MKTPQQWLETVDFDWDEQVSVRMIEAIQQDAFESGRLKGLNEAGELCQAHEQTKTEYMIRLHNLIDQNSQIVVTPAGSGYNFGAKITLEPSTPNPLKSPSL